MKIEKSNFLPTGFDNDSLDQTISDELDAFMPGKPVGRSESFKDLDDEDDEDFGPGKPVDSADNDVIDPDMIDDSSLQELSSLYRVTTKQGDGGNSIVYDAWRIADGAHVALKVLALSPTLSADDAERTREQFLREAHILTSFIDEHAVKCLNVGLFNGAPCIVLEFISGKQLDAYIRDYGILPYDYAVDIVRQVLLALEEAHNNGIIHRDIKPANILLMDDTDPPLAKLIDFGIATISKRSNVQFPKNSTGIIRGTPSYMAPELFSSDGVVCVETDIYAIGLVLLECLTGNVAFSAPSLMQVANLKTNSGLSIPDFVPECLRNVIARCCDLDPANRYHSARDLIFSLDQALPEAMAQRENCEKKYLKSMEMKAPSRSKQNSLPIIIAVVACLLAVVAVLAVVMGNGSDEPPAAGTPTPAVAAPAPAAEAPAPAVEAPAPAVAAPTPAVAAPTPAAPEVPAPAPVQADAQPQNAAAPALAPEQPANAAGSDNQNEVAAGNTNEEVPSPKDDNAAENHVPAKAKSKSQTKQNSVPSTTKKTNSNSGSGSSKSKRNETTMLPTSMF